METLRSVQRNAVGICTIATHSSIHFCEFPVKPWQRINVDFASPLLGSMFLIVMDAHSKWPKMNRTTATHTVEILRTLFARNGLSAHLISYNGQQFVEVEFQRFMTLIWIRHSTSSPYHPGTNGFSGQFIQTFKSAMKSGVAKTRNGKRNGKTNTKSKNIFT